MERVQKSNIIKDLNKKMVFLVGPRQAGKTWLANNIAQDDENSIYLNYDNPEDRRVISKQAWPISTSLLILDELHKLPDWKNYLKGVYDTKPANMKMLVTGSARLEIFNTLGDSLAGRYFVHHLLPLSPAELKQQQYKSSLNHLLTRSGFPEPFLAEDELDAKRWRMQYISSMLTTDVFEFEQIQNIKAMQMTFQLLQHRVGSPVSYQSIAEDIAVSPTTVKKYIDILEALYIVFRVRPFSKNIARSLLKEAKVYFYDPGNVKAGSGAQLENFVAVNLLKHNHARRDYLAEDVGLHYLRTKDGKEVDFALSKDSNLEVIIEVKSRDKKPTKSLQYFHQNNHLPAIQLVKECRTPHRVGEIRIEQVEHYLQGLLL